MSKLNSIKFPDLVARYYSDNVEVDDTLSVEGAAADAKATGDAIDEIKDALTASVSTNEQNLTEAQQMQARKNLGLYYKEGEETVIEWDGDITGKPEVVYESNGQTVGANIYKVSDSVPSIETIIGAKYTATFNDGVKTIESEKVGQIDSNCYTISDTLGDIIIVGTAGDHAFSYTVDDIEIAGIIRIPENGIYLLKFSNDSVNYCVSSLVFGSETIHKIEEKYLPDEAAVKYTEQTLSMEQKMQARKNLGLYYEQADSVVIEWDGDTTGRTTVDSGNGLFYKVSDRVFAPSDFVGGTAMTSMGMSLDVESDSVEEQAPGFTVLADVAFSAHAGVYDIGNSITVPEDGVYFMSEDGFFITRFEKTTETVHKIEEKYLPDTSGAFIVTFTENNGEWTADKTFDETAEAIENGSVCLAKVESVVEGDIPVEEYYPVMLKILPSESYNIGQISFGTAGQGRLVQYILAKYGSTQMAMHVEDIAYDDPKGQDDGKILMSQNEKWTAVTPDFASESYVNQQISAAIADVDTLLGSGVIE